MKVETGSALLQLFLCDEVLVVMPFCSLRCGKVL